VPVQVENLRELSKPPGFRSLRTDQELFAAGKLAYLATLLGRKELQGLAGSPCG
jgi:hypothetical protein